MQMIDTVLYSNKYLTKDRCVIHLVVVMLSGSCGCGGAGAVQTSVPNTLLVFRLLVDTEERGRPRTETMRLLEHSQQELLQTKSTQSST